MSQKDTQQDNVPRIAVVTDSAAALDPQLVQRLSARGNFVLVPMPVTIRTPGEPDRQLQDLTAAEVDEAIMLAHVMGQTVSTSGPAPGVFADVYDELASRGFTHVVSVHLSGELSGTVEAARTGARLSRLGSAGVSVVDSRTVAGAYGHAVVRALEVLNRASDAGSSVEHPSPDYPSPAQLVDYIKSVCEQSTLYFYIPTLDALRRGGRVSPALAMVGQMFQIKPIGTITEGKLAYVERPRTAARALERLVEVTVQTCREHQHAAALTSVAAPDVDSSRAGCSLNACSLTATPRGEVVAVHHVGNATQAVQLYEQVQQMLGESSLVHTAASSAPEFLVSALPPVLSAHSGLGAVALVVY